MKERGAMKTELRLAKDTDLDTVISIIEDARHFLAISGSDQWQHSPYPARSDLAQDIFLGFGHLFIVDHQIAGYVALITGENPYYDKLSHGKWLESETGEIIEIGRMALLSDYRGRGLSKAFYQSIFTLAFRKNYKDLRLWTHPKNSVQQHLFLREGFKKVGILDFEGERWAYQKLL